MKYSKSALTLSVTMFALTSLSGCTGFQTKQDRLDQQQVESNEVARLAKVERGKVIDPLVASAKTIQDELQKLNTVTLADAKPKKSTTVTKPSSPELNKRIDLTWAGDPVTAVESIVKLMPGWKAVSQGEQPVQLYPVHLDEKNETIFNVLRKIGLQVGRNAGLTIDQAGRKIFITYLGGNQS